jgi:hypothetical protein
VKFFAWASRNATLASVALITELTIFEQLRGTWKITSESEYKEVLTGNYMFEVAVSRKCGVGGFLSCSLIVSRKSVD